MASENAPIFISPGDDPEMDQAATKGRKTFRFFWRELAWERRRIVPGLQLAAVKASFSGKVYGGYSLDCMAISPAV